MTCSRPWTVIALLLFVFYAPSALASPLVSPPSLALPALSPRASPVVTTNPLNGSTEILDFSTRQPIPQGPGTDGSGFGFSVPAVLWIVYCVLVGFPLLVAGVRGWRSTTGAAVGLAAGVCAWAAFINTVSGTGIPDLPLTLIVLGFVLAGSIFGALPFMRVGGIAVLGVLGGLAAAVRIVVVKNNLLISDPSAFYVNWLLIAGAGAVSGGFTTWKQRAGIVICAASVGSFLVALALDLVLHKQDGLSRALRFLFDRNSAHLADLHTGYDLPLSTQIIVAVSLALMYGTCFASFLISQAFSTLSTSPPAAFAQHKLFPQPFNRNRPESFILSDDIETKGSRDSVQNQSWRPFQSRLTMT